MRINSFIRLSVILLAMVLPVIAQDAFRIIGTTNVGGETDPCG